VHILLAFPLALWSPVMCCCAIKGAIGTVAGTGHAGCALETCCANQASVDEPASCCAGDDDNDSSNQLQTKDSNCRCHERVGDKVQLNTGGKIHVPIAQLIVAHFDVQLEAPRLFQYAALSGAHLRAHPPPRTLVNQHCLLLM
jgi:hypothetical protein